MLAKPWPGRTKTSYRYSSVVFNCTTNDKDATVTLEYQEGDDWRNVIDLPSTFPNGSFMQRGQIIVLKKLFDSQGGLYRCIAKSQNQDEICLSFGPLFSARKKLLLSSTFVTAKVCLFCRFNATGILFTRDSFYIRSPTWHKISLFFFFFLSQIKLNYN